MHLSDDTVSRFAPKSVAFLSVFLTHELSFLMLDEEAKFRNGSNYASYSALASCMQHVNPHQVNFGRVYKLSFAVRCTTRKHLLEDMFFFPISNTMNPQGIENIFQE